MNNLYSWIRRGLALRGLGGRGKVKLIVLQGIAMRWSAYQLRNTIKFKPRLLSYK